MRRHGLTVDNLRAVDLVTADGEAGARRRRARTGTALGAARRRRQLRHRHRLRVRPASGRADGARRADLLAAGAGARGAAVPARVRAARARTSSASRSSPSSRRRCRSCRRSATARRCSGCCWPGAATSPRGHGRSHRCGPSAHRSPTWSARCPTAPCSPCSTAAPRPATTAYWRSHRLPDLSDAVIDDDRRLAPDRSPRRCRCSTAG